MRVLKDVVLDDVIFIDIETARVVDNLELGTPLYESWCYKMERSSEEKGFDMLEAYKDKAALYPEYARVVCITVGRIKNDKIVLTTYADIDEKELLRKFNRDLNQVTKKRVNTRLCGHSVIGFDIPFIMKRCIVNQVYPNHLLDVAGLKPWEQTGLDTKMLWKGSAYYASSLIAVCVALGVDSPKSDITGAEVGDVYYSEGESGLIRIIEYCERDVVAVANVIRVMRFEEQILNIEVQEVKEDVEETVFTRIGDTGIISQDDHELLVSKACGLDYSEKEKMITMLKAVLVMNKQELSEDLELEILSS